ncbi:hypothetical protein DY000_02023833 [Brassica cretica]|uniref:Uncharacterized protein n=1 Tax=Brassica cretica TaxID=69181 RepID=A0ABQ7E5Z3_BRACR|nr:hypothetical protein DY000_02023833 [Brassica cretica]
MISIPELCRIYSFDEAEAASKIPPFLGLNGFWEIIGTGAWDSNSATKKETVGSFMTPIFEYLGIRLDPSTADRSHCFFDEQHLMNSGWLKEELLWSFRIGSQHRLLQMPNRTIIDFDDSVDRLRFMPDAQLLRDLPAIPRRPPRVRRARATQGPPEAPLPAFPIIPDILMRDQVDFQRVVVDAFHAIWARVSCTSRRTIRTHSPAAAGRSRQCRDPSPGSDDETSEDTD